MNAQSAVTGVEFVRLLQSLGIETHDLSFDWMLKDAKFGGVLKWIYSNLDHTNVLTAREEYRYNEIQKDGAILSAFDLDAAMASIQEQYPGICIPGDEESKKAVELDIKFQEERLALLEEQEIVSKAWIQQNERIEEQLTHELTQLNAAHHVCAEEEDEVADECMSLAQEIEMLMEGVIHGIANNLDMYANCKGDKDLARHFITFSPVESYRQSMALFRSHHDLYVSKCLGTEYRSITEELKAATAQAVSMEKRLTHAALEYVKTKADLSGEQAKLALVSNFNNVHPSQITTYLLEATSAIGLLEQEENIAEQRLESAVEGFVKSRTDLAVGTANAAALEIRLQIESSLSHLLDVWQRAFALDRLLYYSLRLELKTLEEFVQFAADLRQYVVYESNTIAARIESMKNICSEHTACSEKLQTNNPLTETLCTILGVPPTNDPSLLVKAYSDLQGNMKKLKQHVEYGFLKKEEALVQFKSSTKPLEDYIWSGCTKQPHCWDLTVASLSYTLKYLMENVDKKVLEGVGLFARVKNGDKRNPRKLWQWFLTDQPRFMRAMNNPSFDIN